MASYNIDIQYCIFAVHKHGAARKIWECTRKTNTISHTQNNFKKHDRKTITGKFFALDFKAWVMDVESMGNDR